MVLTWYRRGVRRRKGPGMFHSLVSICAAAAGVVGQPAAGPSELLRPWPVHIVDCGGHPGGKSPLMVVGTLFTGGHCYREDDGNRVHVTPADEIVMPSRCVGNKYSSVMTEYVLGNIRPRPSCNEEETCVFLTSPPLNNGFDFTVDSVTLEGSVWTVRASYWNDDVKHMWGPGPNHEGQMLRLGWLKPGSYTCKLELTSRMCKQADKMPGLYVTESVTAGEVKFEVGKGDPWAFHPWDQEPSKAVLRQTDMKPVRAEPGPAQQMLYYAAKRITLDDKAPRTGGPYGPKDRPATANVFVTPELDWKKWGQKSKTLWEIPGEPPANGLVVVHVYGGKEQLMGKYDWAEVTSIERQTGPGVADPAPVTIHAKVWTRDYIHGNDKKDDVPGFAVPIVATGGLSAVDMAKGLKVNVVWTTGTDNPRDAVVEIRH